ncbi:hypothetical protein ACFXO9_31685 [Nocardia tengchongensis]|uniref:hypothetical protein n=1 Tax=Nocardia tengchongensis TaxID=2055889 RepID=UPI0036CD785F
MKWFSRIRASDRAHGIAAAAQASVERDECCEITAKSPDGRWEFADGVLRSGTLRAAVPEVDWFERWTYAMFPTSDILILALNTGQPYERSGPEGSVGNPQGFLIVLELDDRRHWVLAAFELALDWCKHNEEFVPDAVVWHRRGVLAWLYKGELNWHVRRQPQRRDAPDEPIYLLDIDSNQGLIAHSGVMYQSGDTMTIDDTGRILTFCHAGDAHLVDVDLNTESSDGRTWEPIPEGLIVRH